jgi:S-disulfanyl-L-cysteine oxidoreductase SoxD
MSTRERHAAIALLFIGASAFPAGKAAGGRHGLGKPIAEEDVLPWNIDVRPDGAGLPAGRGTAAQGKEVYVAKCSTCHGEKGEGSPMDRLVGGAGTLATEKPVKTVGSYWPYATTLFDYVRRTMPFTDPQGLSADETYAVTAYVLFLNGIVEESTVLDARTLPAVAMPNRGGFVPDSRPDAP